MAGKTKTWVWVVVGVVAFGILGVIAVAAAGLWFARTHINIRPETAAAAVEDFQHARAAFAGQTPLIELDERGRFLRANTNRPNGTERPQSLTVMAFDPHDERIVRVDIPFWILRLKMRGTRFSVGSGDLSLQDLNLTVEDLERFGPTLIVDHTDPKGQRVLVWSR